MSVYLWKAVIVLFTNRKTLDKLQQPTLAKETISFAEVVNYLGTILDKNHTHTHSFLKRHQESQVIPMNPQRNGELVLNGFIAFTKPW